MAERQWFVVPAGTQATTCRSGKCSAPIYFIKHPRTGRPHPIDCAVPGGSEPSLMASGGLQRGLFDPSEAGARDGRGVSHFDTCIDAARFRHLGDMAP
jgi:hypothetical protein